MTSSMEVDLMSAKFKVDSFWSETSFRSFKTNYKSSISSNSSGQSFQDLVKLRIFSGSLPSLPEK